MVADIVFHQVVGIAFLPRFMAKVLAYLCQFGGRCLLGAELGITDVEIEVGVAVLLRCG